MLRPDDIHANLTAAASELSPALAEAIAHNGPLRLSRARREPLPTRLCRAVAGQQLSVLAAGAIWARVLDAAADEPLVDYLRRVPTDELRVCGLSRAKARAMRAIAEADRAGRLDTRRLGRMTPAERSEALTAIWGVGAWTADMINIFYFGDPDVWPDGDVTARKTLVLLTSARRKTTKTAARFAPYRSYLALHMWRHANAAPLTTR